MASNRDPFIALDPDEVRDLEETEFGARIDVRRIGDIEQVA